MTLQELIDKAVGQATLGVQPADSPALDAEGVAESLLPQVFEEAARKVSASSLPRLTKTVTFTNGVATLSSDVLTGEMSGAVLYDPTDPAQLYSFVPWWEDFVGVSESRLGHFTVRGGSSIYVVEPGEGYAEGDGLTGTLTLVVAGVPAVPATASSTIDAPAEFLNRVLDLLAERLRGLLPEREKAA